MHRRKGATWGLALLAVLSLAATATPASAATGPSTTSITNEALESSPSEATTSVLGSTIDVGGVTVTARDDDSATAQTPGGAAVMTVLEQGEDTARFDVTVPDGALIIETSEGRLVVGSETFWLAVSERPWAVDANGERLATHYEVEGSTIVQHVDTTDAAFPVVADPSFKLCDWATTVCVKFNRTETKRINDAMIAGLGAATGVFCGLIPWSPWYLGAIKVGCVGMVAAYWVALRGTFKSAQSQRRCVELKFFLGNAFPRSWKVVNC